MPKKVWLALFAALALVGCAEIERKSDLPNKKPLAAIKAPVPVTLKWEQIDASEGTDRKDINLGLVRYRHTLYTVDYQGNVAAIAEENGEIKWRLPLRAAVSAGPAVNEGKLIVGTNDGKVIAVDVPAGKKAWQSNTTSEILATPRISQDMVYIHTMDGGLSALSLLDGRQLWRFTHNLPPLMLRRSSAPVIKDDLVIAGFANGKLLAMRNTDGSVVWAQDISHPKGTTDLQRMIDISADPLVDGDTVYAASYQGNTAALTTANGNLIWERAIPSFAGFAADRNLLYVSGTNGDVVALDRQNGGTYWLQSELQGRHLTTPAVMGNYLVVADDDGLVHWIEKTTGKLVAKYEIDREGVTATPIVNNNIVYILGCSGKLVALEVH